MKTSQQLDFDEGYTCYICDGNVVVCDAAMISSTKREQMIGGESSIIVHQKCLTCKYCNHEIALTSCWLLSNGIVCPDCRNLFSHCYSCDKSISEDIWIRKFKGIPFHISCFSCSQCYKHLNTGDNCAMRNGRLECAEHQDNLFSSTTISDSCSDISANGSKRRRTTFSEDQRYFLQQAFMANHSPSLFQIAEIAAQSGLSKKVIRVWFQNTRARGKKEVFKAGLKKRRISNSERQMFMTVDKENAPLFRDYFDKTREIKGRVKREIDV